jgi:hypothetical protein
MIRPADVALRSTRPGKYPEGRPSWTCFWVLMFLVGFDPGLALKAQAATNPTTATSASAGAGAQSIGIEGRAVLELPAADYQAKPLDDRTELILRIEKVEPIGGGQSRYHFHFIGLEPGAYALADYLIRPDGSRPDEIGEVRLQVQAMLPEEHDGQLNPHLPRPFPFIGGYRAMLIVLAVTWVGGLVAFRLVGRKRTQLVPIAPAEPEPGFAERLRPLVEAAATGQLSIEGQANLERLLMGYWRERLSLPEMRMAEALGRLKQHAEAGALLRAVERWLHQPGAVGASEIKTLLQPYRNLSANVGLASAAEGAGAGAGAGAGVGDGGVRRSREGRAA